MKKLFCIVILLAIALSFGCDRYPDGPLISFRSVQKRLEGKWQIIGFTSNGVDSLQNLIDSCGRYMGLDISEDEEDNNVSFTNNGLNLILGHWTFSNNKTIMNVNFPSGLNQPHIPGAGPIRIGYIGEEWKILKLEMKALKISTDFNGRSYLISFKKE